MERIEIHELDQTGVVLDLTPAEVRALAAVGTQLAVEWVGPARARVRPAGCIGSVRLSEQRTLAITTKEPVRNVIGPRHALAATQAIARPIRNGPAVRTTPLKADPSS